MNKVVFCGFGQLGAYCLDSLIENGYDIRKVYTHESSNELSVYELAKRNNLEVTFEHPKYYYKHEQSFRLNECDFLVSVNYRYILPESFFSQVRYPINIHGSLLPKYRGRTPHVWAIIHGEQVAGITSHIIEKSVDTGNIVHQIEIPIEPCDTGYTLLKKFEAHYPNLLIESLENLKRGLSLKKQDENQASYFGKRTPEMGYIDFCKKAEDVFNFVRAQASPYPGAYYYLKNGRQIIIHGIKIIEKERNNQFKVGVIHEINGQYVVNCNDALLEIDSYEFN